ncbi:MAG: hypothetical protein M3Y91_16745, partial [Actinomycetota bacterium]|nr:hypothetical protein [Actinomycetota bacterium]
PDLGEPGEAGVPAVPDGTPPSGEGGAEAAPPTEETADRPIVTVDPELERLLAEEEDIERRTRDDHHETPHFPKDA